jgi:ubiquinone/menaquinone biosynthesis C-methylase UbiE
MDQKYAKYLLEKTREDYNLLAEDFSRTRSVVWEELKLLGKYILPGDKILDLGCGNGRLLQILGEKNIEYFGVDNSEKLIKIAKEKYLHPPQVFGTQKFGRARINFQVADALNLPFSDNFFDKVYSIAVLHHIPSTEFRLQFLKEI